MRIFEIFGLSRSGHHAMVNWVIKNMTSIESEMMWKLEFMENGLIYINEANLDTDMTLKYIKDHKENMRVLLLSYENCNLDYSILNNNTKYTAPLSINLEDVKHFNKNYRIVFIRDFYNNLASRIMSNEKNLSKTRDGVIKPWNIGSDFIEKWKESARNIIENKCIWLKYEDWVENKKIRGQFIEKILGHGELFGNNVKGTHSSFKTNNTLDRFSEINLDEKTKDLIRKDSELHYLMGALGYEYKEI